MIVVADTTPLNYLILIDRIDLLQVLYSRVIIPPAVQRELQSAFAPASVRMWTRNTPSWLELRSPTKSLVIPQLDPGETEAILLAEELHADWLLMDELAGRQEARKRRLRLVGTLGILVQGHRLGKLDFRTEAEHLVEAGFHANANLIAEIAKTV